MKLWETIILSQDLYILFGDMSKGEEAFFFSFGFSLDFLNEKQIISLVAGGTKPATLDTGAIVNVPLFINIGNEILVDIRTRQYMNRA